MIGLHARSPAGAAGLSSFTQGTGFLLAAVGPFGVGILHQVTGTWTAAMVLMLVAGLLLAVAGIVVSRPWVVEDEVSSGDQNSTVAAAASGTGE